MIETNQPGWTEEELKKWISEAGVRPIDALAYFKFVNDTVALFNLKTLQAGYVPTTTMLQNALEEAIKTLQSMQ